MHGIIADMMRIEAFAPTVKSVKDAVETSLERQPTSSKAKYITAFKSEGGRQAAASL